MRTVAAILANPRYTGRQVWNRQRTDRESLDTADDLLGESEVHRWNAVQQWVISQQPAHPALVSEEDFVAVQGMHTAPIAADGTTRAFLLTGILVCQPCGRPLDAHWVHGRPAYRCRHGRTSTKSQWQQPVKTVYVRQDRALAFLTTHLPELGGVPDPGLTQHLLDCDVTLTCDHYTWRQEVNSAVLAEGWPSHVARVPVQRRPRKAQTPPSNQTTSIHSVGNNVPEPHRPAERPGFRGRAGFRMVCGSLLRPVSTEDYQDPVTLRQWQWANATELITGKGTVVAEYFDVGFTRRLAWSRRPRAAALLEAVADARRGLVRW